MNITLYFFYCYVDYIIFLLFSVGLCLVLLGLCYLLSDTKEILLYLEKISGYECGFDPFSDAREQFNVKFYLVSILFILFDLELVFFFPWIMCQQYVCDVGFFFMYIFFFILVIGFSYEWQKRALD